MRMPNDLRLAKEVEEIDLILGGHDHVSQFIQVENRYIVKSGTDFQQFSEIALRFSVEEGKPLIRVRRVDVTSEYDEDMNLKPILDGFQNMIGEKMGEVLGEFGVPLDGRSTSVRTSESNLGNFICDIMMASTKSDLALLTSGTLRSDRIHPPGPFTLRDLNQILPMLDNLVVVEISGAELLATLENGVSQYPKLEGRFLQVGGMSFAFDPMKPPLQRVDPRFVRIGDQYLELQTKYRLITKSFMHAGSHGFHVLNKTKILVGEEDNMTLIRAVQTHFETIKKLQTALELRQQSSTRELEKAVFYKLEPRVEGRIVIIDQDTLHQLQSQRQFKEKFAKLAK